MSLLMICSTDTEYKKAMPRDKIKTEGSSNRELITLKRFTGEINRAGWFGEHEKRSANHEQLPFRVSLGD